MNSIYPEIKRNEDCEVSFSYRGPFSDGLTGLLIELSENVHQSSLKVSRKVSFLLVECFQNVLRHGEHSGFDKHGISREGLFHFKKLNNAFVINSINLVKKRNVADLQSKIDAVNGLDSEALREAYKACLRDEGFNEKGGAGLGLFEIARKSGKKIVSSVDPFTNKLCLFHQQITFSFDQGASDVVYDYIDETRTLFHTMEREDALLQYKGDISQRAILPLLEIVESGFRFNTSSQMRKAGHALIEMLQNICKHGEKVHEEKPGMFIFGGEKNKIYVKTGNYLTEEAAKFLTDEISNLNALDDKAIRIYYRQKMEHTIHQTDHRNSGIGLIEIARACSSEMRCIIDEVDQHLRFFSFGIEV